MSSTTTVQKLKSLIEAIDLMSEDEAWTPTSRQWTRIKEMIETLEEAPAVQAPAPVVYGRPPIATPRTNAPVPNPATHGIQFPQVPVAEGQLVASTPTGTSALTSGVAQPSPANVPSTDGEIPEQPPAGPAL